MDYDTIFAQYHTLYRGEAQVPDSSDDEYVIGMRFANDAIRRWAYYDDTYWNELFTVATSGPTVAGTSTYSAPANMAQPGGYVKLKNAGITQSHIPIIEPNEAQNRNDMSRYCYFTGDANNGYTLHLNPAPDTSGLTIEYVYYKNPTLITTGTDKPEMSNPDFIVNHMLANRLRNTRNPYYTTAKRDAENYLGQMKMNNVSGSWSNPWSVPDNSGGVFGMGNGTEWRF